MAKKCVNLESPELKELHRHLVADVTFSDITPEDEVDEEYICNQQLTIKFTYRWDRKNPTYEVIVGAERRAIDFDTFPLKLSFSPA